MNYAKENYKHKDEIATPVALKIPCHMGKQVFDNGHLVKKHTLSSGFSMADST